MTEFENWKQSKLPYLATVKKLLSEELPDAEEAITEQVITIEAHYARIGSLLAESNSWLDRGMDNFFSDRSTLESFKTIREREVAADGALASVRETRDKIQTLLRAIELRVTLAQSILRQQRGERRMSA